MVTTLKVIKRQRNKPMPDNTVYVGRPTKWGNPHKVDMAEHDRKYAHRVVVMLYGGMLSVKLDEGVLNLEELRGKNLACWCHDWDGEGENPMYCHADLLLVLANREAAA